MGTGLRRPSCKEVRQSGHLSVVNGFGCMKTVGVRAVGTCRRIAHVYLTHRTCTHCLRRWAELFKANRGQVGLLDTRNLSRELPIVFPPPDQLPPAYVAGGTADVIVDVPAVEELAAELGVEPLIHHDAAHDLMLVRKVYGRNGNHRSLWRHCWPSGTAH